MCFAYSSSSRISVNIGDIAKQSYNMLQQIVPALRLLGEGRCVQGLPKLIVYDPGSRLGKIQRLEDPSPLVFGELFEANPLYLTASFIPVLLGDMKNLGDRSFLSRLACLFGHRLSEHLQRARIV